MYLTREVLNFVYFSTDVLNTCVLTIKLPEKNKNSGEGKMKFGRRKNEIREKKKGKLIRIFEFSRIRVVSSATPLSEQLAKWKRGKTGEEELKGAPGRASSSFPPLCRMFPLYLAPTKTITVMGRRETRHDSAALMR